MRTDTLWLVMWSVFVFQVMEANLNGEMNLKIETDLVSVTTHFKELGNPPWGETTHSHITTLDTRDERLNVFVWAETVLWWNVDVIVLEWRCVWRPSGDDGSPSASASHRDVELMAQTRVDIRKLQQFLTGQQVNPSRAMCSKDITAYTSTHTCIFTQHCIKMPVLFCFFNLDIVHKRILHLIFLHEDVSLQYFIPAVMWDLLKHSNEVIRWTSKLILLFRSVQRVSCWALVIKNNTLCLEFPM